ncbi:hypothetical protein OXX69_010436 [Metschnikowia pulcherrima]
MRFSIKPIILIISIFTFTSAVPVRFKDVKAGERFHIAEVKREASVETFDVDKRDIAALTLLFRSLNNSATIALAKTALQLSVTRQQVNNFVGSFIETKGLESILEAADQSGLALDLVLMILTHYETVDGLIDVIEYGKKNDNSSSSSSSSSCGSTGLLGGLLNGVTSIIGLGTGNTSDNCASSSSSATSSRNSTATNTAGASTTTSASESSSGLLGGILGGIGSIFGLGSGSSSNSSSSFTTTAISSTTTLGGVTTSTNTAILSFATLSASTTTTDIPLAITTGSTTSSVAASVTTASSSATTASTSGGLVSGIGSVISSILGREDLGEMAAKEGLMEIMKRDDVDANELMYQLLKRALGEILTPLEKRDALGDIYSQIIAIIGTDSNIEEIFESLAKSGLARNVVYNALIDSGFYQFDVELFRYLVDNNYLSLSSVISAGISSGLVVHIVADFIANSTYLRIFINFVLAIFTGKVNVLGLIAAIF